MVEWLQNIEWSDHVDTGLSIVGSLVAALLVFIIGRWVIRQLVKGADKGLRLRNVDDVLTTFLKNIISISLTVLLIIMVLQQLGVQTSSLLAIVGAAGLAIGLALKDSLGNFASGVMLVMLKPFRADDFVDIAGQLGVVHEVRIFNTIITTTNNQLVTIPNSLITEDVIVNYTKLPIRRIDLLIGVSYDDDLKAARAALEKAIAAHSEMILEEPVPVVMIAELGDSSVNFNVRPWVKTEDYWTVRGPLIETIKAELEAVGCSIPFPQRDVHLFHEQINEQVKQQIADQPNEQAKDQTKGQAEGQTD